ncbi:hypothetical protein HaLaN_25697 [Haematococcus lacustris]|uniref:Uncharacterized protein n=1 Tax=Haematococcus lacustris TaxID=44745 RepID=A0A699ZZ08_HAELA|nr:hypothetical protein HaLaN_25697 [Haematococcus lacustris]
MPRLQVNLRSGAVLGERCAVPLETVAEREQSIAAVWRGYHETYSGASAITIQRGYMVRHNLYGKQRTAACKRAPSISPVESEADSDDFKDGEQGSKAWCINQNCWQEQATASAAVKKRTQQQQQPPRSQQAQEAAALVIQRWVR